MNVNMDAIFSILEVDNAQRSFFRVLPLFDQHGIVRQEAATAWPLDGGLRVVPDKEEQNTFKDRMRTLGNFCMLDLTPFPPESNKIRTNKNFHNDSNERNQYVVYSDAVNPLPDDFCYEIITVELPAQIGTMRAVTPKCLYKYLDSYYDESGSLVTLNNHVFTVPCPGDVDRSFYMPLKGVMSEQPHKHTNADTFCVMDAAKASIPIENDLGTAKAKIKPYDSLAQTIHTLLDPAQNQTHLSYIENPYQACIDTLKQLWTDEEMRNRLIAQLLHLPDFMPVIRNAAISNDPLNTLCHLVKDELLDLEKERLVLLTQIDNAKNEMRAMEQRIIEKASDERKAQIKALSTQISAASKELETVTESVNTLYTKRNELIRQVDFFSESSGVSDAQYSLLPSFSLPLYVAPERGLRQDMQTLINTTMLAFKPFDNTLSKDAAVNLLVHFAMSQKIQLVCQDISIAHLFSCCYRNAFGIQSATALIESEKQVVCISSAPEEAAPVVIISPNLLPKDSHSLVKTLLLTTHSSQYIDTVSYRSAPWPIISFSPTIISDQAPTPPDIAPVSLECISSICEKQAELPDQAKEFIEKLQSVCSGYSGIVPHSIWPIIKQYIMIASAYMDGGFMNAIDYACSQFLLPCAMSSHIVMNELQPYLSTLPVCSTAFSDVSLPA